MVWSACDLSKPGGCSSQIQARRQPAGGSPETVINLSLSGLFPEVDIDDDGDAAVVWSQDGAVAGRRVSASGDLVGPVQTLQTSAPAGSARVAVAPSGEALAVWIETRNGSDFAAARHFNVDGSLGPALTLGDATNSNPPAVGVDRDGRFVAVWVQASQVSAARIEAGSVSPTVALTTTNASYAPFGNPQLGVDGDGDAVISYISGGGGQIRVWASRWSGTGTLADPLPVSSPSPIAGLAGLLHAVATDLEGDSILVWTRSDGNYQVEMLGRQLSRDGTLGPVTSLGLHDRPDVALDDDGDGLVVSSHPSHPNEREITAHSISASGSFGDAIPLSSDGRAASVDASPTSRFTVVWQQASHPNPIKAVTGP